MLAANEINVLAGHTGTNAFGDAFGDESLGLSDEQLGWSLKRLAKGVAKGAFKVATTPHRLAVKGLVTGVKYAGKGVAFVGKGAMWLATKPIRSRINVLTDRRARKLAWDRRKSNAPTPTERGEARNWTKAKLRAKGPHGKLAAMLAGPTPIDLLGGGDSMLGTSVGPGGLGIEPVTLTAITASIPLFIALVNGIINKASGSGEAPADPSTAPSAQPQAAAPDMNPPTSTEEVQQANAAVATEVPTEVAETAGYLGAPPDNTAAIVLGVLGAAAVGAGIYGATRR